MGGSLYWERAKHHLALPDSNDLALLSASENPQGSRFLGT
jgi:hypothetical protein